MKLARSISLPFGEHKTLDPTWEGDYPRPRRRFSDPREQPL